MKETNFKVLMHCGIYVDANLLEKGIYEISKPTLYYKDETIETITEKVRSIQHEFGLTYITEHYIENLKQCQLVDVELLIK